MLIITRNSINSWEVFMKCYKINATVNAVNQEFTVTTYYNDGMEFNEAEAMPYILQHIKQPNSIIVIESIEDLGEV